MRKTCPIAAFLILACSLPAAWAAEEEPADASGPVCKIKISKWTMERIRWELKAMRVVNTTAVIENTGDKELTALRFQVAYEDQDGNIMLRTEKVALASLAPKKSATVVMKAERVPDIRSFVFSVEYQYGGAPERYRFLGMEMAQTPPELEQTDLLPGQSHIKLLSHTEELKGRSCVCTARVKNLGELEATDVKAEFEFFYQPKTGPKKSVKKLTVKLGDGRVKPGETKNLVTTIPNLPDWHTLSMKVSNPEPDVEWTLAPGKFTAAADIEFANLRFRRDPKTATTLVVSGSVRNGTKDAIKRLEIELQLFGKDGKLIKAVVPQVTLPFAAGDIEDFSVAVPDCAKVHSYAVGFKQARAEEAAGQGAGFKGVEDVEVAGVALKRQGADVVVTGKARNGKKTPVKNIKITFILLDETEKEVIKGDYVMEGELGPAEEMQFTYTFQNCPKYHSFKFATSYGEEKPLQK